MRNSFPNTIASVLALFFIATRADATVDATLQMQLGNPSGAIVDTNNHSHYLIQRSVEAIDYSDALGQPVWASWDLTAGDLGGSGRNSSFYTDTNLPPNFYRVTTADYDGDGAIDFNRGHLCPSEDRTDNTTDNKLVFFMSNVMPQSAPNNQGVWKNFESFCQGQTSSNEVLVICGGSGFGTNILPSGKAFIPSNTWKIAVFVPLGSGTALSRLTSSDRVIATSIPNVTNGLNSAWETYVTSPRQIELDTGFTFFTALPTNIATVFRAKIDGDAAPSITSFSPTNGSAGTTVTLTGKNLTNASTVWFNGRYAAFLVWSASQITALVPAGATSGQISVVASGGLATSAANFTVTTNPPTLPPPSNLRGFVN